MFMITAIGTAVIIENIQKKKTAHDETEKSDRVGIDKINVLRTKGKLIEQGTSGTLVFDE